MLVRLIIWMALGGVGFAAGMACFRGKDATTEQAEERSLESWSTTQPSALTGDSARAGSSQAERAIDQVRRTAGGNLGEEMLGYLRLVQDTPLDGLEALLIESEKTLPETDTGGVGELVREAIIKRLIEEDPDRLLQMVAGSESETISEELHYIMGELLEQRGYEAIHSALAESQYPVAATNAMQAALQSMSDDPAKRFELAIEYGRFENYRNWSYGASEAAVDLIVDGSMAADLSSGFVSTAFRQHYAENPSAAMAKLAELSKASDRQSAISGIGKAWTTSDFSGAQEFATGLESDSMRLAFLRSVTAPKSRRGARDMTGFLQNIIKLEDGHLRRTLVEEQLTLLKQADTAAARNWAVENDQLETFEKLIIAPQSRPEPEVDPSLFPELVNPLHRGNAIDALLNEN